MTVDTSVVGKANMHKNNGAIETSKHLLWHQREEGVFLSLSFALRHSFCFFTTVTSDKSKG